MDQPLLAKVSLPFSPSTKYLPLRDWEDPSPGSSWTNELQRLGSLVFFVALIYRLGMQRGIPSDLISLSISEMSQQSKNTHWNLSHFQNACSVSGLSINSTPLIAHRIGQKCCPLNVHERISSSIVPRKLGRKES